MAKTKKSPTASRSSKRAKPAKAKAARPPASSPKGRKWRGGRLTQTDLDAVADGKGRVEAPAEAPAAAAPRATRMLSDPRLPAVGTEIVRTYKDREYRVVRQADCFIYGGREYPSLSKIAREIIGGAQVNGFAFFGLNPKPAAAAEPAKS